MSLHTPYCAHSVCSPFILCIPRLSLSIVYAACPSGPLIGVVRRHPSDLRSRANRFFLLFSLGGGGPYHCDLCLRSLRRSPQCSTQIFMSRPSCVSITWLCFPIRFSHSLSPPRLPPPLVSQDPRSSTLWACLFLRFLSTIISTLLSIESNRSARRSQGHPFDLADFWRALNNGFVRRSADQEGTLRSYHFFSRKGLPTL